jgi:hypothetical protein
MGPTHQRPTFSILSGHFRPPVAGMLGSLLVGCCCWTLRQTPHLSPPHCACRTPPPLIPFSSSEWRSFQRPPLPPALSSGASSPHRPSAPTDRSGGCAQASCYSARAPCPSRPTELVAILFFLIGVEQCRWCRSIEIRRPGWAERPSFFLAWTLTKVVHLMDLFCFYPGGFETRIPCHHPPSPPSSLTTTLAGASPPLLCPLHAEEKCHGVQRAPGVTHGRLHHAHDITDRCASASSHRRPPTARAGVSGPHLLTPPLLLSNLDLTRGRAMTGNTQPTWALLRAGQPGTGPRGAAFSAVWAVLTTYGPSSGAGRKSHRTEAVGQKIGLTLFLCLFFFQILF